MMKDSRIQKAAAFLQAASTADSIEALDALIRPQYEALGAGSASWVLLGSANAPPKLGFVSGPAPEEWVELYQARGYVETDPAVQAVRRARTPFAWEDVRKAAEASEPDASVEMFDAIGEFGFRDGFVVPLHGADGTVAAVTYAGESLSDDPDDRSLLFLLGHYYDFSIRRLLTERRAGLSELTPRQRECLMWAARGKTDWEIAVILGLSESTVNRHIERAKERLNARSRAQALVRAFSNGLLPPDDL